MRNKRYILKFVKVETLRKTPEEFLNPYTQWKGKVISTENSYSQDNLHPSYFVA